MQWTNKHVSRQTIEWINCWPRARQQLVGVVCYQSMNQAATARGLLGNWTPNTGHLAHTLTPRVYDHNFITLLRIDLSANCSLAYRCVSQVDPEIDRVDLWRSSWGKLINSIDRFDFWPFSRLSSTQCHGDRLDRLDRLDCLYLPRFLADRTNCDAYATVVFRPSPSVVVVVSELYKRWVLEQN